MTNKITAMILVVIGFIVLSSLLTAVNQHDNERVSAREVRVLNVQWGKLKGSPITDRAKFCVSLYDWEDKNRYKLENIDTDCATVAIEFMKFQVKEGKS